MTVRELMAELIKQDMDFEVLINDGAFRKPIEIHQLETKRDDEVFIIEIDLSPDNLHPDFFDYGQD